MASEPQDWSPRWDRWPKDMLDMVARTLFVMAWADQEEREGRGHSGQELMEVAPSTPPDADQAAVGLMKSFELLNKKSFEQMHHKALLTGGNLEDSKKNREEFGYSLAMEALGTGVGLGDEFGKHGLEVPYIEFYL